MHKSYKTLKNLTSGTKLNLRGDEVFYRWLILARNSVNFRELSMFLKENYKEDQYCIKPNALGFAVSFTTEEDENLFRLLWNDKILTHTSHYQYLNLNNA